VRRAIMPMSNRDKPDLGYHSKKAMHEALCSAAQNTVKHGT
jgi:hypothetical protein